MRPEAEISASAEDRRPFSNGTEGFAWMGDWCYECVHNDEETELWCPILTVAILGKWPTEWTRRQVGWTSKDSSGSYEVVDTCTEFEERRDPGPDDEPESGPGPYDPEMDGQTDIFTFIVEDALEAGLPELEFPAKDWGSTAVGL